MAGTCKESTFSFLTVARHKMLANSFYLCFSGSFSHDSKLSSYFVVSFYNFNNNLIRVYVFNTTVGSEIQSIRIRC